MNAWRAWLTMSLLLVTVSVYAVTTNDPVTAEREGRELAKQLRNAKPSANLTNSGSIVIRVPKQPRQTISFNARIIVTETNWISFYDALNGATNLARFSVEHLADGPNRYRLDCANLLETGKTTLPFAGSEFWLSDLGLEFFHWPIQLLIRREIKRSNACSVLESRNPSPPPGGYSRVVSWIDNDTGGILLAEAYDAKGKLLKEFRPT